MLAYNSSVVQCAELGRDNLEEVLEHVLRLACPGVGVIQRVGVYAHTLLHISASLGFPEVVLIVT